jgi:hypothetical protein
MSKVEWLQRIEKIYQLFKTCPDPNLREKGEGWSIKEILGHLFDSASNNHQRLLRYVKGGELKFPGYDQEEFVRRANYRKFEYLDLLSLWHQQNRLLLHIYDHIPEEDRESSIRVGDREAASIKRLMEDYFAHLEVHEEQVKRIGREKES